LVHAKAVKIVLRLRTVHRRERAHTVRRRVDLVCRAFGHAEAVPQLLVRRTALRLRLADAIAEDQAKRTDADAVAELDAPGRALRRRDALAVGERKAGRASALPVRL